jgi:hypothetical protein
LDFAETFGSPQAQFQFDLLRLIQPLLTLGKSHPTKRMP